MTEKTRAYQTLKPIASLECPVAGISFDGRQKLAHAFEAHAVNGHYCWVELRRDAHNPYDANAIAVMAHVVGRAPLHAHLGFVPKDIAARLAPIVDAGGRLRTTGFAFVGGYRGKNIGMRLDVEAYA